MSEDHIEQPVGIVDKAEALYLRILRWIAICAATIMLAFATWKGLTSAFNYTTALQTAELKPVTVTKAEMMSAATPPDNESASVRATVDAERNKMPLSIYDVHSKKMYDVWTKYFEPYRPDGDLPLTAADFSDWYRTEYINGTLQKHNVVDWVLDEEGTKNDLALSVEALAAAAKDPAIVARMQAFQSGKSKNELWDRYDQTFMRLIDGYWISLKVKREAEAARVAAKRAIIADKVEAANASFVDARNALVGFLGLMFFFLVVAMERHQRRIADQLTKIRSLEGIQ